MELAIAFSIILWINQVNARNAIKEMIIFCAFKQWILLIDHENCSEAKFLLKSMILNLFWPDNLTHLCKHIF